jgi:hypothetical protein
VAGVERTMVRVVRGWGAIRTAKAAKRNRGWFWLRSHKLLYKDQASGLRFQSTRINVGPFQRPDGEGRRRSPPPE